MEEAKVPEAKEAPAKQAPAQQAAAKLAGAKQPAAEKEKACACAPRARAWRCAYCAGVALRVLRGARVRHALDQPADARERGPGVRGLLRALSQHARGMRWTNPAAHVSAPVFWSAARRTAGDPR